jgi:hypothetical protein
MPLLVEEAAGAAKLCAAASCLGFGFPRGNYAGLAGSRGFDIEFIVAVEPNDE